MRPAITSNPDQSSVPSSNRNTDRHSGSVSSGRSGSTNASASITRAQRWATEAGQEFFNATTIRTVTPDSIPEGREDPTYAQGSSKTHSRLSTSTPASPHANDIISQSSNRHYRFRAGSTNELGMRDEQFASRRPRTRTLESSTRLMAGSSGNTSREASPPSSSGLFTRGGRSRMGSSNSVSGTSAFGGLAPEDVVTSIGHPSIAPPVFDVPQKRKHETGKKLAKINNSRDLPQPQALQEASPPRSRPQISSLPLKHLYQHQPDMVKILQLMKSSGGRMEGQLAFRRFETTPWALSYCSINDETGSLVFEPKTGGPYRTLIPDIRGCNIKTAWDMDSQAPYLDVCPQNSKLRIHIRPHSIEEFDSWFAAFLCWQPIRPKGAQNRMTKPQVPNMNEKKQEKRVSQTTPSQKEPPIIKIGKMIYWDHAVPEVSTKTKHGRKISIHRHLDLGIRRWQQVSSTLRENGELKLHSDDSSMSLIASVKLSQLSRCAIQRLDSSVLETEFCLAIYPQYAANPTASEFEKPIFISLENRVLYEVWLVLLRAFTIPELYGPKQALTMEASEKDGRPTSYISSTTDMFRMERSLSVKVMQAKLMQPLSPRLEHPATMSRAESRDGNRESGGGYYAEILLDGEIRAKTQVKMNETNPTWRDVFEFIDLPAQVAVATIVLKKRAPNHPATQKNLREETKKMQSALKNGEVSLSGSTDVALDQIYGQVDIFLDDLESGQEVDKLWSLVNQFGQQVGEVNVNVMAQESVVLMAKDYQPMSELLHRFANGLTLRIAQKLPGELRRLSDCLLNIFQVSSSVTEWINSLIEEEIDGTLKEAAPSHLRFNKRRMSANDNGEIRSSSPHFDRELFLRDMNKSAALEANLLFRGNTLLTKSLDLHMKRLGGDYLEETFGEKLREIAERDADCEVDPNRLTNPNDLDRNWRRLMKYTEDCWTCIIRSASKCPPELRYIFRHIRACAEDRYGAHIRSVKYSSVSGFLFLRFFVPAILNPHLPVFALLKDEPGNNARRTFVLIAKSLQGLANISTFGSKESWMEPMNAFLQKQRNVFRDYIDDLCNVSTTTNEVIIPPSYSTPLAILNRLPTTSREGFPSLPHLIDHARSFAALVSLWLEHVSEDAQLPDGQEDLVKFHYECVRLRKRTEECLISAERADRPGSQNDAAWEDLLVHYESKTAADDASSLPVSSASSSTLTNRGYSHSRADSNGNTPSNITSSKNTYPPILGIRSTSHTSISESPLTLRQQWRGPGRQHSLEILPTSRSQFTREQGLGSSTNKSHGLYDTYNTASPASNATSPFGTSPFGGSDGSADEYTRPATMSRSGRVTPNFSRSYGDHRTPCTFNSSRDMAIRGKSEDRERTLAFSRPGNSRSTSANAPQSTNRKRRDDTYGGHESSDGGAGPSASTSTLGNSWRSTRNHADRIFHKSESHPRPDSASGFRRPPSASIRQHLKQQAELMEPGDSYYGTSPQNAGLHIHRAATPSRQPRRDWADEERRKREDRIAAIGTPKLKHKSKSSTPRPHVQGRAYSDDVVGYQSGETTGDDDHEGGRENSMTALPSIKTGGRGDRTPGEKERDGKEKGGEKKGLLKEMIFKKRKPAAG